MNEVMQNDVAVNGWHLGDYAIVQVPLEDGCFDTFKGVVSGFTENGGIKVVSHSGKKSAICDHSWLYPADYLSQ